MTRAAREASRRAAMSPDERERVKQEQRARMRALRAAEDDQAKCARLKADRERRERNHVARGFVAIDSEGVSFGDKVQIGKDRAQKQRTIFWGAGNEQGDTSWLEGEPFCNSIQIIKWLLDLPRQFDRGIFVWFGSSYDATQIFADMPFEKAWEVQHGKPFSERGEPTKGKSGRYVFWNGYALSYIKQKCLKIAELAEGPVYDLKGKLRIKRSIIIYDVWGFFQSSFIQASNSIPGSLTPEDDAILESGKALRGEFTLEMREEMRRYTSVELRVLARMMERLRSALEKLDLHLTRWQGAGSIAANMMTKRKSKTHYYETRSNNLETVQEWAHTAFFGGRIECLKQGVCHEALYSYDIVSAYPHHMSMLPSMAGGVWCHVDNPSRDLLFSANSLSMFRLVLHCKVSAEPFDLNNFSERKGPAFYPLPYRDKSGRITYPPICHGIYMCEECRSAFEWLDYYRAYYSTRKIDPCFFPATLEIKEAWIFEPDTCQTGAEAFAWLRELFEERARIKAESKKTGIYNLVEKVIKLGLNSVYGKTAQSVGGASGVPGTACPWYAAAITAGTRSQLMRAAISIAPGSIVAFQTDGIVSTRRIPCSKGVSLGDWEETIISSTSYFVQPGVYHLGKSSKHRGIKLALLDCDDWEMWLSDNLPKLWTSGKKSVTYPYRYYVTLGAAVASADRFKLIGHWVDGERVLDVDNLGYKRAAPLYTPEKRARAEKLVDTIPKPAYYHETKGGNSDGELELSMAHQPDWLDLDLKAEVELATLMEEIEATNG